MRIVVHNCVVLKNLDSFHPCYILLMAPREWIGPNHSRKLVWWKLKFEFLPLCWMIGVPSDQNVIWIERIGFNFTGAPIVQWHSPWALTFAIINENYFSESVHKNEWYFLKSLWRLGTSPFFQEFVLKSFLNGTVGFNQPITQGLAFQIDVDFSWSPDGPAVHERSHRQLWMEQCISDVRSKFESLA